MQADRHPIAEAIDIQGCRVLRICLRDGSVIEHVRGDCDPLRLSLRGIAFRIIHIAEQALDSSARMQAVTAFVVASRAISGEEGKDLFRSVAQRLRCSDLVIEIRTDSWFVAPGFPVVFPFRPKVGVPPSAEVYRSSFHMQCGNAGGQVHCFNVQR
jgi:hypothetical protein